MHLMFIITTIDGPFVCSVERNVCLEDGCVATFGWVAGSLPSPGVVVRMVCWRCGYVTIICCCAFWAVCCLAFSKFPRWGDGYTWRLGCNGLRPPTCSQLKWTACSVCWVCLPLALYVWLLGRRLYEPIGVCILRSGVWSKRSNVVKVVVGYSYLAI
jgi:hypothetical protein